MRAPWLIAFTLLLLFPIICQAGALDKYTQPQHGQTQAAQPQNQVKTPSSKLVDKTLQQQVLRAQQMIKRLPPEEQQAYREAIRNKMAQAYQEGNAKAADYYKRVLALWE